MTFVGAEFGDPTAEEEGVFADTDPPTPNGTIVKDHNAEIRKAEFVQTSTGYRLDLNFYDHYYRQTQNAVYTRYTTTGGDGKLQSPSQLPTYTIRLFKKSLPTGGTSVYDNISSTWQPYGSFNSQTFINADSNGTSFIATDYGVGITPHAYWFPTQPQSYTAITQADASNGSGEFTISLDALGGVKYTNSPDFSVSNFPSGIEPGDNQGLPDTTTPLQQFISGKTVSIGNMVTMNGHVLPKWRYCRQYSSENLFSEPGAYLIALTRNAIDNTFTPTSEPTGTQLGDPNYWHINLTNSGPNVSLAYMVIEPPPLSPITIADDVLSFEVVGYGSVSPVYPDNGGLYKYALRNQYEGTPNFTFPGYDYNIGANQDKYGSYDHNQLTYDPVDPNDATTRIVVKTTRQDIILDHTGTSVFSVRGAFQYDFRLADTVNTGFMPYANALSNDGYVNYPLPGFGASPLDTNLVPSFSTDWIPRIRSQVPQLTFSSSQSFGASETITKYTDEFSMNPFVPPDGPIVGRSHIVINEAKFTRDFYGYYLDLTFTDPHYKNTQNAVYAEYMGASGAGKLQAPNQLPTYIIRVFKKTAPPNGKSSSHKIQSLWQPVDSFNTKTFTTSNSGTFDNNNIGVGITPYYYYFKNSVLLYDLIGEVDATGGTGTVSLRMDKNGGVRYRNPVSNIGSDPYYSSTHSGNQVPNDIPFQQVVASSEQESTLFGYPVITDKVFGPTYHACSQLSDTAVFREQGAYLVVIMRNSIDNTPVGTDPQTPRGVPLNWAVADTSLTTPSVDAAFLKIDPNEPVLDLVDTDGDYAADTIKFTIEGLGSVNMVETISSNPPEYRWAITNKYAGTPGFSTPNMPYDASSLSLSTPQGQYDYNSLGFVPSNRADAYETLETSTNVDTLRIAEQSINSFDVRGAFLYDFRVVESYAPYFNPYADLAAVEGYINYASSAGAELDSRLKPNFSQTWISKLRGTSNMLTISDSTTFVSPSSTGQPGVLSQSDTHLVTTTWPRSLNASIYIPVQLNAFIVNVGGVTSPKYAFQLSWNETQSSIITSNVVGSGHVIRIYRRTNTNASFYNGLEFTSNPVTGFKYVDISDTGASVPSSAVTSVSGNNKEYSVLAGSASLYTGQLEQISANYWTEGELFGAWLVILQRNFTPAGSTTPLLITSAAVVTLPNPPAPVITVVKDAYSIPNELTTSILGIPIQNTSGSNITTSWSQYRDGSYRTIYPGQPYTAHVSTLGVLPAAVKFRVAMTLKLQASYVVENLSNQLSLTVQEPSTSNAAGYTGPLAINQFSAHDYNMESASTDVTMPDIPEVNVKVTPYQVSSDPTYGSSYVFHVVWEETMQGGLTTNVVGAKNVLRVFKYEENGDTYELVPMSYARYNSEYYSGLNLLYAYTNYGRDEPTSNGVRNIYMGRYGNVSSSDASPPNFGFTESQMDGRWLFILQRNFSTGNTPLLVTQGCYYTQLPSPPTLASIVIEPELTRTLVTTPADIFPTLTQNKWYALPASATPGSEYEAIGVTGSTNHLQSFSTLTLDQLQTYWPISKGLSYVKNDIIIDLSSFGGTVTSYSENLGTLGTVTSTNIRYSGVTSYSAETNAVEIYEAEQTNDEQYYLTNVDYTYERAGSLTYFMVTFTDPDVSTLIDNNAYVINIFKKGTGSDVTSQWNHPQQHFTYVDNSDMGVVVAKDTVSGIGTNEIALNITASGRTQLTSQDEMIGVSDSDGSFEPGAYLVVIRRNAGVSISSTETMTLPYFTLNSGYIFVPPTDLALSNTLSTTVPIYGSYDNAGNDSVGITPFVLLEGVEDPQTFEISSSMISSTRGTNSIYFSINNNSLTIAYPDSGSIQTTIRVSYDWSAPDSFDFHIGKIGGSYRAAVPYPTTQTTTSTGITVSTSQAITNTVRKLMPSNNYWSYEQGNVVHEARASFVGDANNRLLAIRWEDVKPSDLQSGYTGYPYALRLYKKRAEGATASEQWYQPPTYDGVGTYHVGAVSESNNNGKPYAGVPVSATYLPASSLPSNAQNKSIMYIYADRDGHIWYNALPTKEETEDTSRYHPFTDASDAGGYTLVIQRNFGSDANTPHISTVGAYLHLMPVVSWTLIEQGTDLVSEPNPEYVTYMPGYTTQSGGDKDISYTWTLSLPNIGYTNLIPNATSDTFDIGTFKSEFRNRDKSAVITSQVTYNFSVTQLPFMEAYPLSYISGSGSFEATSQSFLVDLCVKPTEFPPPPWTRFSLPCPDVTPEERAALQMRRKAETLMHVTNKHERRMTKAQQYSFIARGFNQKRQTYASQTDSYTNPNIKGYPVLGGSMVLPDECTPRVLTFPSTASDVPGPSIPLTYDPSVPLINYKAVRTYNTSQSEFYSEKWT